MSDTLLPDKPPAALAVREPLVPHLPPTVETKGIPSISGKPAGADLQQILAMQSGLASQNTKLLEALNITYSQFTNWDSPQNFVGDVLGFGTSVQPPLYYDSRNRGEVVSVYIQEAQLKILRDQSRQLLASNEFAVAGVENRQNYVIGGEGLKYKAVPVDAQSKRAKQLAKEAQHIIDVTREINESAELELWCMRSLDECGEFFVRNFPREDGFTDLRYVEAEHVKSPPGEQWPPETSFGIKTKPGDVRSREAYFILTNPLHDQTTGEWVPAEEITHRTLNVGPNSKRGLPTYYQVVANLRRCEDLLASMTSMAKTRAKIALIRKMAGLTQQTANNLIASLTGATLTDPTNNEQITVEKLRLGSILTTNDQTTYEMPAANLGASDIVDVLQAELRAVASRLQMPEWMFTATADAKYDNAFISEGPVLKAFKRLQGILTKAFGENRYGHNAAVYWKVLRNAVRGGIIHRDVLSLVRINCTGPSLEARDKSQEASTNDQYVKMRIKSRDTTASEQGLDEDERRKIEEESAINYLDEQQQQELRSIQQMVYSQQMPHEAGIASLVVGMGIPTEKAMKLLPNMPPPQPQGAPGQMPPGQQPGMMPAGDPMAGGAPGGMPGGDPAAMAGAAPADPNAMAAAGAPPADPNQPATGGALPAPAATGVPATPGSGESSAPGGSPGGLADATGQQAAPTGDDLPPDDELQKQFDSASKQKSPDRQATEAVTGSVLGMLGIPPEEQDEQPSESKDDELRESFLESWDESKHHRGQPENAGEFGPGGGGHDHAADYAANGTRSKAFKAWFGDWESDSKNASKVVDDNGAPQETHGPNVKAVYHGTHADFGAFDKAKVGQHGRVAGAGFYFAENKEVANSYGKEGGKVIDAYLNIRNPFDFDSLVTMPRMREWAKAAAEVWKQDWPKSSTPADEVERAVLNAFGRRDMGLSKTLSGYAAHQAVAEVLGDDTVNNLLAHLGYDGITHLSSDRYGTVKSHHKQENFGRVWVAFEPNQIKAVANRGTFSSTSNEMHESHGQEIPVGCVMVNLPPRDAQYVLSLADQIHFQDFVEDGRETVPHVTVRHGLLDADADEVRLMLHGCELFPFTLTNRVAAFRGEDCGKDYDVLYIPVKQAAGLHGANAELGDCHCIDTHPGYTPHVTIGYVKAGLAQKYIDCLTPERRVVKAGEVVYAAPDRSVHVIDLKNGECHEVQSADCIESHEYEIHDEHFLEQGFTGQVRDALGRVYNFINGIRQRAAAKPVATSQHARSGIAVRPMVNAATGQHQSAPAQHAQPAQPHLHAGGQPLAALPKFNSQAHHDLAAFHQKGLLSHQQVAQLEQAGLLPPGSHADALAKHAAIQQAQQPVAQPAPTPAQPAAQQPAPQVAGGGGLDLNRAAGKVLVAAKRFGQSAPFQAVGHIVDAVRTGKVDDWISGKVGVHFPQAAVIALHGAVSSIFGGDKRALEKFAKAVEPARTMSSAYKSPRQQQIDAEGKASRQAARDQHATTWATKAAKWHSAKVAAKLGISHADAEKKLHHLFGKMAKALLDHEATLPLGSQAKPKKAVGSLKGFGRFTLKKGTGKTGDPVRDFLRGETGADKPANGGRMRESVQYEMSDTEEHFLESVVEPFCDSVDEIVPLDGDYFLEVAGDEVTPTDEEQLLEHGFTGRITDKRGRVYYYVDGVRTKAPDRDQTGQPISKPQREAMHAKLREQKQAAVKHLENILSGIETSSDDMADLHNSLELMVLPELARLANTFGKSSKAVANHEVAKALTELAPIPAAQADPAAAAASRENAITHANLEFAAAKKRIGEGKLRGPDAVAAIQQAMEGLSPEEADHVANLHSFKNKLGPDKFAERLAGAMLAQRAKAIEPARKRADLLKQGHEMASQHEVTYQADTRSGWSQKEADDKLRAKIAAEMTNIIAKHPELEAEYGKYAKSEKSNTPPPSPADYIASLPQDVNPQKAVSDYLKLGGHPATLLNELTGSKVSADRRNLTDAHLPAAAALAKRLKPADAVKEKQGDISDKPADTKQAEPVVDKPIASEEPKAPVPATAGQPAEPKQPWEMSREEYAKLPREPHPFGEWKQSDIDNMRHDHVWQALRAGKDVPDSVLKDFPDLAKRAGRTVGKAAKTAAKEPAAKPTEHDGPPHGADFLGMTPDDFDAVNTGGNTREFSKPKPAAKPSGTPDLFGGVDDESGDTPDAEEAKPSPMTVADIPKKKAKAQRAKQLKDKFTQQLEAAQAEAAETATPDEASAAAREVDRLQKLADAAAAEHEKAKVEVAAAEAAGPAVASETEPDAKPAGESFDEMDNRQAGEVEALSKLHGDKEGEIWGRTTVGHEADRQKARDELRKAKIDRTVAFDKLQAKHNAEAFAHPDYEKETGLKPPADGGAMAVRHADELGDLHAKHEKELAELREVVRTGRFGNVQLGADQKPEMTRRLNKAIARQEREVADLKKTQDAEKISKDSEENTSTTAAPPYIVDSDQTASGEAHERDNEPDRLEGTSGEGDRGRVPTEKPLGSDAPAARGELPAATQGGPGQNGELRGVSSVDDPSSVSRMVGDGGSGDGPERGPRIVHASVTADPAGRTRPARGVGAGSGDVRPDGRNPAVLEQTELEASLAQPSTPENPTGAGHPNFRYTDDDFIVAGKKAKFNANVAAIRTLQAIEAEGRSHATPEEQQILSRYTGWGQFPQLFNYNPDWSKEAALLKDLLSHDDWIKARDSKLNAHYTSPDIVRLHWRLAQKFGFNGGRFLEPSAGVGYYLGMMPEELAGNTHATAVELDPTTGGMLKHLYPQRNVKVHGFQDLKMPDGFYDLVASNVPFAAHGVHDPRYNKHKASLHDYFFLKSADLLRHGGLMMHITSSWTMDKHDSAIRDHLAKDFDLVGALRFPGGTHQKNAGTEVVTDMLILRKRLPGEEPSGASWGNVTTVPDPAGGEPIPVNEYFANNPHHVLGTIDRTGTMHQANSMNVSKTDDYEQRLEAAIKSLPDNVMKAWSGERVEQRQVAPETTKEGAFVIQDGKLYVRNNDTLEEQERATPALIKKIRDHQAVVAALNDVVNAQKSEGGDSATARKRLNAVYDQFVRQHGFLNDTANVRAFRDDPDSPVVRALENYNRATKKATKADIFHKDTIRRPEKVGKADSPASALGIVLHEVGRVDVGRMAELLSIPHEQMERHLSETGIAFHDPSSGWHPADQYLSGNVKTKLALAKAAAEVDPRYHANVAALEKVQPADIDHTDIGVKIGAAWIPASDISKFASELMDAPQDHLKITYMPLSGAWQANFTGPGERTTKYSAASRELFGTKERHFDELLEHALNNTQTTVYDKQSDGSKVVNREATDLANAKIQEIKDKFSDWVWQDDERRDRLHRAYNDTHNNIVHFKANGSHLQFPGMNPAVQLRDHQKNFIWHTITKGSSLAAHEVGTGKTLSMIASAMELRRLGLAKKPLIACLKANIEQITSTARHAYPGAKILSTAGVKSAADRNRIMSQIATGDHDMVIVTHDNLNMMKMKPETQQAYINEELAEIDSMISEAEANGEKRSGRFLSGLLNQRKNMEEKLKAATDAAKKDNAMAFEDSGVDHLFVDEAHHYKALACRTKQQGLKGIPNRLSDRAANMLMRTRWLQENNGGRGVTFATGTPVGNTMAELYNIQRYLQPGELKERGINSFDAWSKNFGDIETKMEYTVAGEYKPVSRFAKFTNIPELMNVVRQVMDIQSADKMKNDDGSKVIVRPKRFDEAIKSPESPDLTALMTSLKERAEKLKTRDPNNKDNMLAVCTDGRKGAVDMRMINPMAEDHPDSKVNQMVRNVLKIHNDRHEKHGVTQLIFSDMGVNPTPDGFHLYQDIIDKLVAGGIPREKIADFSELEGDKKEDVMEKMKTGEVAIGIGSTAKLGTGVNVQNKLAALHNLDAMWMPANVEQRDGRGWRQGNMNDPSKAVHDQRVDIFRYIAEGSLDQFMWQLVANKAKFIKQAMTDTSGMRHMSEDGNDEEGMELTPEQLMAAASGDPRLMEKVQVDEDVKQLRAAQKRHESEQYNLRRSIDRTEKSIPHLERDTAEKRADAELVNSHQDFRLDLTNGVSHTERKDAGPALEAHSMATKDWGSGTRLAGFRGLHLYKNNEKWELRSDNGQVYPTGNSLPSVEYVARNIEKQAEAAHAEVQRKKAEIEKIRAAIGRPFPKQADLDAKIARQQRLEGQLSGKFLPDGYKEGEHVELLDGRHGKILHASDGHKVAIEIDGALQHVDHDLFPHRDDPNKPKSPADDEPDDTPPPSAPGGGGPPKPPTPTAPPAASPDEPDEPTVVTGKNRKPAGNEVDMAKVVATAKAAGRPVPPALEPSATPQPHEMSKAEFYKKFPYQHTILGGDADAVHASIQSEGFRRGIGPNATLITQGPATNVMEAKYGTTAGKRVYAIAQDGIRDTRNGAQVKEGHKPSVSVVPESHNEPFHRAVVREALAAGHTVPPHVLADYPDLAAKSAPPQPLPPVSPDGVPPAPVEPKPTPRPTPAPVPTGDLFGGGEQADEPAVVEAPSAVPAGLQSFSPDLPAGELYRLKTKDGDRVAIRGDNPRGFGDSVHRSIDEANKELESRKSAAADAERQASENAESARTAEEKRQADPATHFTADMTPMQRSKVQAALDVTLMSGGSPVSRKELVEQKVGEKSIITMSPVGVRRLESPDGRYVDEKQISKTAMDYAAHLIAKRDGQAAADDSTPGDGPLLKPGDAKPALKTHGYFHGDKGEYTGQMSNTASSGKMYAIRMTEGRHKGQLKWIADGPDGSNDTASRRIKAWQDQQAEFRRLSDAQKKPKPNSGPSPDALQQAGLYRKFLGTPQYRTHKDARWLTANSEDEAIEQAAKWMPSEQSSRDDSSPADDSPNAADLLRSEPAPVAETPAVVEPANPHAARIAELEAKMKEARAAANNTALSKPERFVNRRYLGELEDERNELAGIIRTPDEHAAAIAFSRKNVQDDRVAKLEAQTPAVHARHIDNHLAKLDKRIAKMDEANTWAAHVAKEHGKVKWDSEMETVYGSPKEAIEVGFPKHLIADESKGETGSSIDQIAQSMESRGDLQVPRGRNATDYLIEKLSSGETFDGGHDEHRQSLAAERDAIKGGRDGTPEADAAIVEQLKAGKVAARKKPSGHQQSIPEPESGELSTGAMDNPHAPEGTQHTQAAIGASLMDQLAASETPAETATDTPVDDPVELPKKPTGVSDFGEFVPVRKHAAQKTGRTGGSAKPKGEGSGQPAWRRHYEAKEDVRASGAGKWHIHHGDKVVYQNGDRATYGSKEEAEAAIPGIVARDTHSVTKVSKAGEPENWSIYRRVAKGKYPTVKDGFASYAEAEKHLQDNPEAILNHKFPDWEEYSYLDHVRRDGDEHRPDDQDATPQDFQKAFGFRAGVFGNWQTNKDGQTSLNHAYDALHDLSEATGLSRGELSLGGKLAIGFGADGHGGKHAAKAHYSLNKGLINLTKMRGAGSLGHEWFHALDHAMAQAELGDKHMKLLTEGVPIRPKSQEIVDAWKNLVHTMSSKDVTSAVDAEVGAKKIDHAQRRVEERLKELDERLAGEKRWNKRFKDFTPAQQAEWDDLKNKISAGDYGEATYDDNERSMSAYRVHENVRKLNALFKASTGRSFITKDDQSSGRRFTWDIEAKQRADKMLADAQAGAMQTKKQRTDFHNEAIKLDETRASDYFSTPEELAARAFSAYLEDKLAEKGKRSDYLAAKSHNKHYKLIDAKPFPEGDERTAINAAFDKLFAAVKRHGGMVNSNVDDSIDPAPRPQVSTGKDRKKSSSNVLIDVPPPGGWTDADKVPAHLRRVSRAGGNLNPRNEGEGPLPAGGKDVVDPQVAELFNVVKK